MRCACASPTFQRGCMEVKHGKQKAEWLRVQDILLATFCAFGQIRAEAEKQQKHTGHPRVRQPDAVPASRAEL
eukprot:gene16163-biopygen18767